jgi:beta-lactamase superfamily II metal-dependent hydrolase
MFNIQMLPADHGDCLLIEYGNKKKKHKVLIDGGTPHSFKAWSQLITEAPGDKVHFELFVITHVDADHIGGALELFRSFKRLGKKIEFGDVWFNGWRHLSDTLGDMQGELVTDHLVKRKLPWNRAFSREAIVIPPTGELPSHRLPGGLLLTLLSPTRKQLDLLKVRWQETITEAKKTLGHVEDKEQYFEAPKDLLGGPELDVDKLVAKPFKSDRTVANGSSIALLAEYIDGKVEKRCLLTGDAHVGVLMNSLQTLMKDQRRVKDGRLLVDALKLSHHGSKKNVSKGLLDLLDCSKFLFSTNGQQFKHPDPEAVARVVKYGRGDGGGNPKLFFNYNSAFNKIWNERGLLELHEYEVDYPAEGTEGLVVKL